MATKILSGLILPNDEHKQKGNAFINLNNHSLTGDIRSPVLSDSSSQYHQTIGPANERFNSEPCKIVALREITFADLDHSRPSEAVNAETKTFSINTSLDVQGEPQVLTVSWKTAGNNAKIIEISYLIIGDAG